MTQQIFSYDHRSACVCGAALDPGAPRVVKDFPRGQIVFSQCPACQSYVQAPVLTPDSLSAWFDSTDYQGGDGRKGVIYADYGRDEATRLAEARQRYDHDLAAYLPEKSHVFEVGCASGSLLAAIAEHGHKVAGCDLSPRFVEAARTLYGLDVVAADWNDVAIEDASLDAVLMLGTVSGINGLDRALETARRKLKPGGFLFFNFPAADSLVARVYGSSFWMFTPSVMQFMSRRGIHLVLKRAGFRVEVEGLDRQAPSLRKLLNHMKIRPLYSLVERLGLLDVRLPVALPLPGIYRVLARPE